MATTQLFYAKDAVTFQKVTGVKLQLDGLVTAAFGRPCIDIVHIDKDLEAKYRYQELHPDWSMKDFLEKKFGKNISDLVERYI